ncbi:MAG: hypothetical protein GEU28_09420 [Dehalococcoidia bacterium]|nr:hypothetical protein [Dehalococcoidia bacterium]
MPALLATIRERLRIDLKDPDLQRWSDSVLDRHIARTVSEYGRVLPREQASLLATEAASRFLDVSSLVDMSEIEAIEYPADRYPRSFVAFTSWAGACELLVDREPEGDDARVYWHGAHALSLSESSIRTEDEEIIVAGAAAYALLEYGQYSVDRINLGGDDADGEYHRQGRAFLQRYEAMLDELRQKRGILSGRMYSLSAPAVAQRDVVGEP